MNIGDAIIRGILTRAATTNVASMLAADKNDAVTAMPARRWRNIINVVMIMSRLL